MRPQVAPHTPRISMVFDGLRSHRHQHRPWLWQGQGPRHGPQLQPPKSVWPQWHNTQIPNWSHVMTQTLGIYMAPGSNMAGPRTQTWLLAETWARLSPWSQVAVLVTQIVMAPLSSTALEHQHGPDYRLCMVPSSDKSHRHHHRPPWLPQNPRPRPSP